MLALRRGTQTSITRILNTAGLWRMSQGNIALDGWVQDLPGGCNPSSGGDSSLKTPPPRVQAAPAGLYNNSFHTSPMFGSLGVVEQLHEEVAIALPADASRSFWEVVEFRPDGTALETWKTPEVLHLHPRDVHVFTSDSALGHRAMIAPRPGAILFRTESAKAVIYSDKAVLFPARRLSDTVRVAQAIKSALSQRSALPFELKVLESLLAETARSFDTKTKRLGLVAEAVVEDINRNFHASAAELQRFIPVTRKITEMQHDVKETLDAIQDVADYDIQLQLCCLTDRNKALGSAGAGRQSPQQKGTPTVQSPSTEGKTATERRPGRGLSTTSAGVSNSSAGSMHRSRNNLSGDDGGNSDEEVSFRGGDAYFSRNGNASGGGGGGGGGGRGQMSVESVSGGASIARTPHMRMASRILEAYEFKLLGTQSTLAEMMENMEQTRTVWHMQLDHQRNRVLRVNLLVALASFGGFMSTIPAAFFGMNLDSGFEQIPGLFWPVVQGSLFVGLGVTLVLYTYYKFGPKRRYAARLRDMRSLRDLLFYHMDDMDSIIQAVKAKGSLTKSEFKKVVATSVKGRPMSPEEVSLLFRVLDQNRNAVLELSELVRMEDMADHLSEQLAHHTS